MFPCCIHDLASAAVGHHAVLFMRRKRMPGRRGYSLSSGAMRFRKYIQIIRKAKPNSSATCAVLGE